MFISVHYFVLYFLVLVGLIDLAKILIDKIVIPDFSHKEKRFFILIQGHIENLEYIVRSIIYNHKNNFSKFHVSIIVLNFGIDEETKKICKLLLKNYEYIKILDVKPKIHHSD